MNSIARRVLMAAAALASTFSVSAQTYPEASKTIRFVIGFPAGSTIDNVSRVVLENIRERTSASIVVDNRPGALGWLGVQALAKAPPDGYTLGPSSSATHSSGPYLSKAAGIDPVREFTHIGRLVRFDVLVATKASSYTTAGAVFAAARANPGKLSYGYGSGTGQVVGAAFARAAGITVLGVPYKGQPPALADLIGGQVDFVAADLGSVMPHVRSGQLSAVALVSDKRSSILPDVPTANEVGLTGLSLPGWIGISGPHGLAAPVVVWWENQIKVALSSPEVIERLFKMGVEPDPLTGASFQRFVQMQHATWGTQIKNAGIQPE